MIDNESSNDLIGDAYVYMKEKNIKGIEYMTRQDVAKLLQKIDKELANGRYVTNAKESR